MDYYSGEALPQIRKSMLNNFCPLLIPAPIPGSSLKTFPHEDFAH